MKLEELIVYKMSMELGEEVWNIVIKWDYFLKDTIGKQLVRSVGIKLNNYINSIGKK